MYDRATWSLCGSHLVPCFVEALLSSLLSSRRSLSYVIIGSRLALVVYVDMYIYIYRYSTSSSNCNSNVRKRIRGRGIVAATQQ